MFGQGYALEAFRTDVLSAPHWQILYLDIIVPRTICHRLGIVFLILEPSHVLTIQRACLRITGERRYGILVQGVVKSKSGDHLILSQHELAFSITAQLPVCLRCVLAHRYSASVIVSVLEPFLPWYGSLVVLESIGEVPVCPSAVIVSVTGLQVCKNTFVEIAFQILRLEAMREVALIKHRLHFVMEFFLVFQVHLVRVLRSCNRLFIMLQKHWSLISEYLFNIIDAFCLRKRLFLRLCRFLCLSACFLLLCCPSRVTGIPTRYVGVVICLDLCCVLDVLKRCSHVSVIECLEAVVHGLVELARCGVVHSLERLVLVDYRSHGLRLLEKGLCLCHVACSECRLSLGRCGLVYAHTRLL